MFLRFQYPLKEIAIIPSFNSGSKKSEVENTRKPKNFRTMGGDIRVLK